MSRERYFELISYLKEGYKLNLKTFIVTNPKGRALKLSKHGERPPVVSIKKTIYNYRDYWCLDGNGCYR